MRWFRRLYGRQEEGQRFSEPTSHVRRIDSEEDVEKALNAPDRQRVEAARERWLQERGRSEWGPT